MIKREKNGEYCLYSKDGKKELGKFKTEKQAKEREAEIEYFKKKNTRE